ncbi:MAG: hypothetical protein HC802_21315 [Caldilineaceae bacterium]|nr:hypothetical protein [Caldilineaceae bacterium]
MFVVVLLVVAGCTSGPTPPGNGPVLSAQVAEVAPVETAMASDSTSEAPASLPTPTKEQQSEAVVTVPTAPPEPEQVTADWTGMASVEGDYFVLGNPNAPLRLIDYSDFM